MIMTWHDFHGAFSNSSSEYGNAVVGGSPNDFYGRWGVDLRKAHDKGYGYGIRFTQLETETETPRVKFELNLVHWSIRDDQTVWYDVPYVQYGGTYDYYLLVHYSYDGGKNYQQQMRKKIFSHPDTYYAIYGGNWEETAKLSQWQDVFTIPKGVTHVRMELQGADVTFPHHNVFPISVIIPDYRPMAIRKNSDILSLDRPTGKLQMRKGGTWKDLSKIKYSDTGKTNLGSARIRKSNVWKAQKKLGK